MIIAKSIKPATVTELRREFADLRRQGLALGASMGLGHAEWMSEVRYVASIDLDGEDREITPMSWVWAAKDVNLEWARRNSRNAR